MKKAIVTLFLAALLTVLPVKAQELNCDFGCEATPTIAVVDVVCGCSSYTVFALGWSFAAVFLWWEFGMAAAPWLLGDTNLFR